MDDSIDLLLARLLADAADRRLSESTYRLQFHAGFTFAAATAIVPYLDELGVSACYASPFLKARPGSQHGYDITDHKQLNPEIGTESDRDRFSAALQARGMGQILDAVPNHMAVGNDNAWWNDVLENGQSSPYVGYFDLAWSSSPRPELQGRILVPILGDPYVKVLEARQIRLDYSAGAFTIHYFDRCFPVAPRSLGLILTCNLSELEQILGPAAPALLEYQSILTAVKHLPRRTETDPALVAERQREKEIIKRRLAKLTDEEPRVRAFIERIVQLFNGRAGEPRSFDLLEKLLEDQVYRLAYWRVAADEINYRRFFDINELAALAMEREDVFTATHEVILQLSCKGKATGLRIDHPDGLYDPRQYLRRLQIHFAIGRAREIFEASPDFHDRTWDEMAGPLRDRIVALLEKRGNDRGWPLFVVVEKILVGEEVLPEHWPIDGTTGYDFLNVLNGLFVDGAAEKSFARLYRDWANDDTPFAELVYQKKILILQIALSSELQMLAHQLDRLAQKSRASRDFTLHGIRQALREIIACFPVYRSYIDGGPIADADLKNILRAVRRAIARNPAMSTALFHFVRDTLVLRAAPNATFDADYEAERLSFVGKFQQVTGPVMAKAVEDTAFYIYNRLLSLNEVGGDPERFGLPPAKVHQIFQERQARWPHSFSATSTHDTKRAEDVRARLNVLSEMPDVWQASLARWSALNRRHRVSVEEAPAPDANEEYFLYQTLLGAWPIEPCGPEIYGQFVERIKAYLRKALQEAKVHTSWINPNAEYDEAIQQFVDRVLDPRQSPEFLADLRILQKQIGHYGTFNSLSQTLLKIAAPGIADFYQGTELWDFSLVDPDNRRPVDYALRQHLLREMQADVAAAGHDLFAYADALMKSKEDGRIKMFATCRALACRRHNPGLFTAGEYLPLEVRGAYREHVFGFARRRESRRAVAIVPRLLTHFVGPDQAPCGPAIWQDTTIPLPEGMRDSQWRNVFTNETLDRPHEVALAEVLRHFPVALLVAD